MTVWTSIAMAAILGAAVVEAVATWLNIGALQSEPPAELRHLYDAGRYRRSQSYTRASSYFALVSQAIRLTVLVAFWLLGGFGWLDDAVRSLGLGAVPTGLLYLGTLAAGQMLVGLPLRWWRTFRLEARFGFNRTTPRTFWTDTAKAAALGIAVGGPLAAAALWIFASAGERAWLWCWLAVAAWTIVLQYLAPTWLLPLFNRFTPLADGALRDAILRYTRGVGFALAGVYVIDGSRRSSKANAFFTGFGRNKRIALFDTLTAMMSPDEIVAVVAHEVGHHRRHHVVTGLVLGLVEMGAALWLLAWAIDWRPLFEAFFVTTPSPHVGVVLFGLVARPAAVLVSAATNALSRRHELAADAFAAETTGHPRHLATALERLAADTLANLTPHPLHVALHYSHPPLRARLARLRAAEESCRATGA